MVTFSTKYIIITNTMSHWLGKDIISVCDSYHFYAKIYVPTSKEKEVNLFTPLFLVCAHKHLS